MSGSPGAKAGAAPTTLDALRLVWRAFKRWDRRAVHLNRQPHRLAWFAAVYGPLAVLLLTAQVVLVHPEKHMALAAALIAGELACLLYIVLRGLLAQGTAPAEWVIARLRAEALRRERFLLYAKVGPYLNADTPAKVWAAAFARVSAIEIEPTPANLACLSDPPRAATWRDELENAGPGASAQTFPSCLVHYQERRVRDQERWFSKRSAAVRAIDRCWENVARGAILAALVLAAGHLVAIVLEACLGAIAPSVVHRALVVAAIVLPPVGMAMTGLQSIYEGRRLGQAYGYQALRLTELDVLFTGLAARGLAPPITEFQLKRLVLRSEEILGSELQQFWHLMGQ